MSRNTGKDYSSQAERVINQWERKLRKQETKVDAFKEMVKDVLEQVHENDDIRDALREELADGRASGGDRRSFVEGFKDIDGEVITGFERPWERD